MKRLFLFIATILSLQASAQILNGPAGYGRQEYRFRALNFLGLPVQDTICDLIINGTNGTCEGAVVYKPEDSTLYVRTASHWRPLAKGGDLGDYYTKTESDARYPLLSGSYSNPSWITGLAWSKITGAPTTLAGYGITDAIQDQTAVNQDASFRIAGNGYIGGNVGIGTTNPINPFTINSTTQLVENNYTTYGARIDQNGSRLALGGDTAASYLQTFNSLPLVLNGLGNNVGIGGIPTSKLSVVGSMNATGTVTAGSIPARASPAPVFLTHTSGTLNTRTTAQVLSDINAISSDEKGAANGVATLDASSKVPLSQIPESLLGAVNYQGTYDAVTNTPALPAAGTSNKGWYYVVSTAGTQEGLDLQEGDWVISNGSSWGKVDNNNAVTSVFGRTGAVTAQSGDYTTDEVAEGSNKYYTDQLARNAVSAVTPLTYNSSTGVLGITAASETNAGYVTTGFQTFAGSKVFANNISIQSVPGKGSPATHFFVPFDLSSGIVNTRTAAEVLGDIGAAPEIGSGNYVQIDPGTTQTGGFDISGPAVINSTNTTDDPITDASMILNNSTTNGIPILTFQAAGTVSTHTVSLKGSTITGGSGPTLFSYGTLAVKASSSLTGGEVDIVTFSAPFGSGPGSIPAAAFNGRVSGVRGLNFNDFATVGQVVAKPIDSVVASQDGGTSNYTLINRATTGNPTITLGGSNPQIGQILIIKEASANPTANGINWTPAARYDDTQYFSNFNNPVLSGYTTVMLQYDGTDWWIIGRM